MRKILIIFVVLFSLVVVVNLVVTKYLHVDIPSIVKVSLPPKENISDYIDGEFSSGNQIRVEDLDFGKLEIFADLSDIGAPRVLNFDENGVLYASIPGKGEIVALPDKDNDGRADEIKIIISDLNKPHGFQFYNGALYIAESNKVMLWGYNSESMGVSSPAKLFDLPSGGRHWSRTIKIYDNKLFTAVGSSCDVCEEEDSKRSTILVSDLDGKNLKIFASGLRNTVFFDFDEDGKMWGSDMGRDMLGDNLPPDELNMIEEGNDYGWPYCYGLNIRDTKFASTKMVNCDDSTPSKFNYPAHIAPLGTTFVNSDLLSKYNGDLLVSFHGSWNSTTPVGYKIVRVDIENGEVVDMKDFITGFIKSDGTVLGRPVDLVFGEKGELYISDDKANKVYIVR